MSYSVYFKYRDEKYKLPVNPEEIRRNRRMEVETCQVLGEGQISTPSHCSLEEYRLEAEFPGKAYHYIETPQDFRGADEYERMFRDSQQQLIPLRLIASNDLTDDISAEVLVVSLEVVERAGEEGDKYISLRLLEYRGADKRFIAKQTTDALVKYKSETPLVNPTLTEYTKHTVTAGETLWGLAKQYYGNGSLYTKIYEANSAVKNPNLIYNGQVLAIPQ